MPVLSQLTRKGQILLVAGVAVVVGALVVTLVLVRSSSSEQQEAVVAPPAAGDRLLQAVNASVGTSGAIDQVGDTVVITRANTGQYDTTSTSYDPSKVVDQLPVRVLTSYRTAKSSGTDLADLKGYTGRVAIDLTVQNLTVKPQQVSYDAGGTSRTSTAMVGAPLTVVASASLPGVDPATVVTPDSDADAAKSGSADLTNGVLSRAADQTTQVQWATILAPPQLSATATLRLVVDAKDFAVPNVDISVQPGLVTDPSVGALVDSAFNPKNSDELKLVSRTIEVVGDVNQVLDRASGQISKVRKTLDSTSQTLGTKTVAALQSDTKQIDTSLKQSDKNLGALDKSLQSSLKSTSSSTLQQLSSTVSQVDALLGDTSASAPSVKVSGEGCAAQIKVPDAAGTVYGSLLQVTSLLNAYASTTGDCKEDLQRTISATIGPEKPTQESCQEAATSVTCTLSNARQSFADVTKAIKAGQDASKGLNPEEDFKTSQASVTELIKQLTAVREVTDKLLATDQDAESPTLEKVKTTLEDASAAITTAQDSRSKITDLAKEISNAATTSRAEVETMRSQNADAAQKLCDLIKDPAQTAPSPGDINAIHAYLLDTPCPGTTAVEPPSGVVPMSSRLKNQADAWDAVIKKAGTDEGIGKQASDVDAALTKADDAITSASSELASGRTSVTTVNTTAKEALGDLDSLSKGLTSLQGSYTATKTQLDAALADAAKSAEQSNLQNAIDDISKQSAENSAKLGNAFDNSAKGLSSAAKALQDSGKKAVNQQRADLATTQKEATTSLSSAMTGSLDQISGDISSATRDLGTTRTQLTKDLANILLDLGDPKVKGSGVIGTLSKGANAAGSADYQLALAADQTAAYGSVREQDVAGIMLRQAQAEAALQRQADLPAFVLDLPDSVQHRTVYTFHLAGGR